MRWLVASVAGGAVAVVAGTLSIALLAAVGGSGGCGAGAPSGTGEPPLIQYYVGAAAAYGLGPDGYAFLAAINRVETSFGTDTSRSSAGAVGWMQFEPATFAQYGVSVTAPSAPADPEDPQDAIYTAARYLHASGAPGDWPAAIFAYNHASWYVSEVETDAQLYNGPQGLQLLGRDIASTWGGRQPPTPSAGATVMVGFHPAAGTGATPLSPTPAAASAAAGCAALGPIDVEPVPGSVAVIMPNGLARPPVQAPLPVQAMVAAGDRIVDFPYSWGGGHCTAAMNQQRADPQACPGSQENGGAGYDCSGSTSYVLWGGGLQSVIGGSPQDSGTLAAMGSPGTGRWVTWMANAGHVYIEVAGIFMNTENGPWLHAAPQPPAVRSATGPRWSAANAMDSLARSGFTARHPEGL